MAVAPVHPGNSLSNGTRHPVAKGQLPAIRNEMIDLDIWRAAHVMIEAHSDQAALKARQMNVQIVSCSQRVTSDSSLQPGGAQKRPPFGGGPYS